MTLPSTCRCIRVFSSYKLNKVKMKLFENQLQQKVLESKSSNIEMEVKQEIALENEVNDNNLESVPVEKVESSKSLSDQSVVDTYNMEIPDEIPSNAAVANKMDYSLMKTNFSMKFKIKTLQFLTSYKFVAVVYITCFLFNTLLWLLMAGIEFGIDKTGKKFENGASQLFVYPGMFEFRFGCVLTINGLILVSCLTLIYLIFEIGSIILLLMADRDAWNIKTESIVIIITQVIGLALFVILGNINGYITLVDYIIPYSLFLFAFASLEIIITVLRPIAWEIYLDRFKKNRSARLDSTGNLSNNKDSQVASNLEDENYYQKLLDFARRCYCPESLLCWKSIQQYKKENYHNKKMAAEFILEQFLTIGAPAELNIENVELRKRLIISKIESEEYYFGNDLFEEIETHCVNDLADLINRFKFSNQ
ncbi:predicted protein [Naegleria gruberi]|uniref:Predicted protein n=1 Tax=Naegleria gruberi TaxID=5762 RepID=D2VGI3_NAEGR|nr:uncharacterized protein NAEGRDRAFT_67989 [Naegleria gruberi]EFC44069.1 predicted protein [Naegleria gruberi]|eukprot:XP_002676813.1 predicted protein [Naegleria gruberi strain NEG-M]